ncbi:Uncharacterised protein [Mycobacteroides abscessus subsp. massiliense]|nr:Uncharacterised protein [Mycobacteroides abscessus subsp. massiliense]
MVAGAPQLIHHDLGVHVRTQLSTFLRAAYRRDCQSTAWSRISLQKSSFELRIDLGLADEFADDGTRSRIPNDTEEGPHLRAQVALDLTAVREIQVRFNLPEIPVKRQRPLGRPPLVDRHLARAGKSGDLVDGEPPHAFGEQQLTRRLKHLLAHLFGRSPPTARLPWPSSVHRHPPLLALYVYVPYIVYMYDTYT